jgi:hypothetical protein
MFGEQEDSGDLEEVVRAGAKYYNRVRRHSAHGKKPIQKWTGTNMKRKMNQFFQKKGVFLLIVFLLCFFFSCAKNEEAGDSQKFSSSSVQINPFEMNVEPEIDFVDGVPIFPWARPVVILKGSDYEMGYQYSKQLAQIFGSWILGLIQHEFSPDQTKALKGYQWHIAKYAPEMIDFFKGMAAGAKDVGVTLTYEQVLAQFCLGVKDGEYVKTPPDQPGYPDEAEDEKLPSEEEGYEKCGSCAAWGTATKDGKVITAGSSDGNDHFNVTIICFPDEGNSYIHSPYYAVGPWVSAGGHSGMNEKGLVYVHHGVTQTAQTMGKKPRYGIQSDIAIRHTLRFADNAEEAVELILSYETTGDHFGGGYYGTGGFWVDKEGNAFVIERTSDPVVIRKPGDVGETDFMYATNTLLSKELGQEGEEYIEHGGWLKKGTPPCRDFSVSRNLYIYNLFKDYHGYIDLEFMKMVWRFRSQPVPVTSNPDAWDKEAMAHYEQGGCEWWTTIGHITNAFVAITIPEDKLYFVSTTYPSQQPTVSHPMSFHGARWLAYATRAFYRIKLESSPAAVRDAAKHQAETDLFFAQRELGKLDYHDPAYAPLDEIFNQAVIEWTKGDFWRGPDGIGYTLTKKPPEEEGIYYWAKATRSFLRCQLLARKVYNALVPPATKPSDLGLKPWKYEPPGKTP